VLDYLVLILHLPAAFQEPVSAWLFSRACLGLECEENVGETRLRAYFDEKAWTREMAERIQKEFPGLAIVGETAIRLPEAGERLPAINALSLGGENFRLLSGPAFGSGAHPTTQLCAELLRRSQPRGLRILDVGTGTGILALLAHRLGAAHVDAVEISAEARENARANFDLNGAQEISLHSELGEVRGAFDLVLANLLTPTLMHLGEEMLQRLVPGGRWLISGITVEEGPKILGRFAGQMELREELQKDAWLGMKLSLKRPSGSES